MKLRFNLNKNIGDGSGAGDEREHEEKHGGSDAIPEGADHQTEASPIGHADRTRQIAIQVLCCLLRHCCASLDRWGDSEEEPRSVGPRDPPLIHAGFSVWHVLRTHDGEGERRSRQPYRLGPFQVLPATPLGHSHHGGVREDNWATQRVIIIVSVFGWHDLHDCDNMSYIQLQISLNFWLSN